MSGIYKKLRIRYEAMRRVASDKFLMEAHRKSREEAGKRPIRTDILNYLLSACNTEQSRYLEIGVRNPEHNFSLVQASVKYSVDPGVEFESNPVDFKLTSDEFFRQLREGQILRGERPFDVIFIDGLHTAEQTDRDIQNALDFVEEKGFVVLHDCNPPTESHARETYDYWASPALDMWNGTTWKAFFKHRKRSDVFSCCVDSDWGVGILSRNTNLGPASAVNNEFYEYAVLEAQRRESLNLVSFEELKNLISRA